MTSIDTLKNAQSALIDSLNHTTEQLNALGGNDLHIALVNLENAAESAKARMTDAVGFMKATLEGVLAHIQSLTSNIVAGLETPSAPFIPQETPPEPAPSEPTESGVPYGTPDTSTNSITRIIADIDEMFASDPEVVIVNSDDLPEEHREGIEAWGERVQSAANSPVDPTPEPHRKRKRK